MKANAEIVIKSMKIWTSLWRTKPMQNVQPLQNLLGTYF